MSQPRTIRASPRAVLIAAALIGIPALGLIGLGLAVANDGGGEPPALQTTTERPDVLPRGDTPAESARLLADWLRERAG